MHNPVKLYFGSNATDKIGKVASGLGKKALVVYGKGSIKKNGVYDRVVGPLKEAGIEIFEYEGIKSNPIIEDVDGAAKVGKEQNVDMIVAVGGGSVIDSSKIISVAIPYDGEAWDFFDKGVKPKSAVPILAVLTLAATGTEMNSYAVVQNHKLKAKSSFGSPLVYPKASFLNPEFTQSVPENYTSYGIVDLMAHAMEVYFGEGDAPLSDKFVVSILREALEAGPLLMEDLTNYDLRARIMYAATSALNGMCSHGRKNGDWGVHYAGHVLSLLYDVPHGASLSIVYPAWLKLMSERIPERISELGFDLFRTHTLENSIYKLEYFFKVIKSPVRLNDIGIGSDKHAEIIEQMKFNKVDGQHLKLSEDDYKRLVELMA